MEQLMPIGLPDATFGDWPYHRIHPLILLLHFQVQAVLEEIKEGGTTLGRRGQPAKGNLWSL